MSEEYCLEEEYDPESRFADLSDVEPEFWRKKTAGTDVPPRMGTFMRRLRQVLPE